MVQRGFTLIELLVVIVIIGILIAFIIRAAMGGVRRAEEKATIALIAKLETAMTDRVDALTNYRAEPTPAHYTMAALHHRGAKRIESIERAQVIAQFDYLRSVLPDVFFVQPKAVVTPGFYPVNFAAAVFGVAGNATDYMLPLGANAGGVPVRGMYGAAFEVSAGIYKQLGYCSKGYDGNDNNSDGYIDDFFEGVMDLSEAEVVVIKERLARHKHKTARSEMLYAILVEGVGVSGGVFDRDDFTSKEVQDTDGDGLLEFVDAWGEPLQFYRWPILFRSDSQKGFPDLAKLRADVAEGRTPGPYSSVYESREQNPLDPNQTLLAPAWWGSDFNNAVPGEYGTASGKISGAARFFMAHFITLVDPMATSGTIASNATFWDRSTGTDTGYYVRRAYYSRFLILSGGPDKIPGVAQLGVNYRAIDDRSVFPLASGAVESLRDSSGSPMSYSNVANLLVENQAGRVDPDRVGSIQSVRFGGKLRNDTNTMLEYVGLDDITSQMFQSVGGPLQ
ncbi:prepilin-type N-terminal cleavage/methylation domain-containing protein [Singulisphaera sp. GP187]|uniref:prepilin-type N-terminal cleavage/methylation domain-containing protein n=1 Tax=Singulisphaera sp. GP187 TaxID=1882752 RepID=UPI00092B98F9|nr:prepilin-type N-terminal cleavage/methylation domain-containing protein [Singulisphaera sp. GP187]SIN70555.1 prepilin-type N-terminal cleavage/methylation domain-containing protein [Singulisphaera sp. GP187]